MAEISKIQFEDESYDIKDAEARAAIEQLKTYTEYLGVTTTELTDGAATNPITVEGESKTAVKGNIANYGAKEFIFNGTAWQEFGDMSAVKALAFKDAATGDYTPEGTISQPTASASTTAATVNSITDVGTLPSATVEGETLILRAGTLPTKGADTTVVASVDSVTVSQPTFSGTSGTVTVS